MVYLTLLFMLVVYSTGNVLLKKAAAGGEAWMLGAAFVLYLAGNLGFFVLMKNYPMGVAVVITAVSQLIVMAVIDRFLFGQSLSAVQLAGLGLAIVAMALVWGPAAIGK